MGMQPCGDDARAFVQRRSDAGATFACGAGQDAKGKGESAGEGEG